MNYVENGREWRGTLRLNGRAYDAAALRGWEEAAPEADRSELARQVLAFCRDWLRGDSAFRLHTSGSTGEPKPIDLTRRQMEASALATGAALGLEAGQSALVCLPTRYVAGRMMLVRGLVLGLHMTVVEPAADPFATLAPADRFDFTAVVPLQLQTLLDSALVAPADSCFGDATERAFAYRARLEAMRAILVGGGPVSPALETQISRLGAPVFHTYGMTETATHIALRRLNGPQASDRFYPLPGVELRLDGRGCLAIRGAMTADEWVQTNDSVDLDEDAAGRLSFVWLGRWDNVINSGGVKVQVEQVEAAIEALRVQQPGWPLGARRCIVGGLPDERLGQVVTLVVEGEPLSPAAEAALSALLRGVLDRFALPRRFVYVPHFAETPTGKIDRGKTLQNLPA